MFPFSSPEEFFGQRLVEPNAEPNAEQNINRLFVAAIPDKPEIIVMVGYPGSGKSTLAKNIKNLKTGYSVIHRDEWKTIPKMKLVAEQWISVQSSVIIDATHSTKENRKVWIDFAEDNDLPIRCIFKDVSMETAMLRNSLREESQRVPKIVFYRFRKSFEMPTTEEGFTEIIVDNS